MKTKRYPGVRGKVVQYVESVAENGDLVLGIQFTDKTYLAFIVGSQVKSRAELLKVKGGNESVLKTYKHKEHHA